MSRLIKWVGVGVGLGVTAYWIARPNTSVHGFCERVLKEADLLKLSRPRTQAEYDRLLDLLHHYNRFDLPQWLINAYANKG